MLVFIDESGDPGFKLNRGSSRFFVVALVVFEDNGEAVACDQRINLLRREIKLPDNFEFHFKENSHRIRLKFLEAIAPYNFFYFGIALNKDPEKLWGEGFKVKESLYKYACSLVFENAKPYLRNATVVIDKSGHKHFQVELRKYLKEKANINKAIIRKIKTQRSKGNNLLQLVDYIAGVVNRNILKKKRADEYKKFIVHKEIYVQIWPR
ncbi:MAG: hypothetical protein A3A94_03570 [Candidatus Portnoybacteria bacterium RIFCSPLOWO2_01_FULL_43_11]|uniref:DUF3800 domain-containing protein n=4 Tax=Bacteria candidate phyla TaxID=1783234 RepID=A0A1G2FSM9_9BACT|nr:MAG: hypothetical protein A2713_01905 [candidate division WWE3 bacterium RIFCSPHIGHO2_01_FULL_35_17]OGZ37719.1 MAG: hypothetical protein A3E90_00545 [Candidatus Portnoybacteria bacterium RIFCSPHIGHO2_12_FULL_40_11]OGZ38429.1 MAG: hypothetical protein A3A94_03570 [Candidatus Portnoybacteria bacterium RIFCSPLOWO2_01_FULL_43_11]OGZ40817.1 MAG: hypothetical protein A3I20_02325 [Candidatus Portnoybacteria bacterium RIFCSPLOWO2_02_FULL_40_15]